MAGQDAPAPEYRVGDRVYRCPHHALLRPLTPAEDRALRADVAARGVVTPVVVTPDGEVLDGANRLRIAVALGLTDVPVRVVDVPPGARVAAAVALNVHRRHLSRRERRDLVGAYLLADPGRSNAAVADDAGVTDKTVAAVRREKEAASEIPELAATVGRDGRRRKARRPGPAVGPRPTDPDPPAATGLPPDSAPPGPPCHPPTITAVPVGAADPREADHRVPVVVPTRGEGSGSSKPLGWWPRLKEFAHELDAVVRDVARLTRLRAADRGPGPVADVARRLRRAADEIEKLAATPDR